MAICLLLLGINVKLHAQGTQATITGRVSEKKEGAVIGATIIVRNESTGFQSSTMTNEKGEYTINQLPLGSPYSIKVSYLGFGDQQESGYTLNQGDNLRVDFELHNSSNEMQSVEVSSSPLKNTIKTLGSATHISARDLDKMPVNGRNFTSLIDLSPLSNGSSLGGQLASSTNYTVDGMTSRGTIAGGSTSSAYSISMEAIREFKVITNEYDVTNGRSGGGTISTVTKSGTNKLSGSAFTFGRTDWLSSPYDIRGNKRIQEYST